MRYRSMNPIVRRGLVHLLVAGFCTINAFGQATPVTLILASGERVDAVLKSATATEIILDDVGTERKYVLTNVSQVIVGKPPVSPVPMRTAFMAFRAMQNTLAEKDPSQQAYKTALNTLTTNSGF